MDSNRQIPTQLIEYKQIRNSVEIKNINHFIIYLKKIFPNFCKYEKNKLIGLTRIKFFELLKLPIIICDKLFYALNTSKSSILSIDEFSEGMTKLYFGTFEESVEIIFSIYDYNKDGFITKEEVKLILIYLPLKTNMTKNDYKYQQNSLEELDNVLSITFNKESKLSFKEFINAITKVNSFIYLELLCYFYLNCPFNVKHIDQLISVLKLKEEKTNGNNGNKTKSNDELKHDVKQEEESKIVLPCFKINFSPLEDYLKRCYNYGIIEKKDSKVNTDEMLNFDRPQIKSELFSLGMKKDLPITTRKEKESNILKDLDFNIDNDEELRYLKKQKTTLDLISVLKTKEDTKKNTDHMTEFFYQLDEKNNEVLNYVCIEMFDTLIFVFSDKKKQKLKDVIQLSTCFIKDNGNKIISKKKFYSFSIMFQSQIFTYYNQEKSIIKLWVECLRTVIGYRNIFDYYELTNELYSANNYTVKIGVNKSTKEYVSIKIYSKTKMTQNDIEAIKSEIDLLRMIKHPNFAQFIDFFENSEFLFLVDEYYKEPTILDFFRVNKVSKNSDVVCQLIDIVRYLKSFGIVHTDFRADNIKILRLASKDDDDDDIRYMIKTGLFGIYKLLDLSENPIIKFGNIHYLPPEIINYSKDKYIGLEINVWNLGIILYQIIFLTFPFGDLPIDKYTPINYNLIKNEILEKELVFINEKDIELKPIVELTKNCLIKNPRSRITIGKIVNLKWVYFQQN